MDARAKSINDYYARMKKSLSHRIDLLESKALGFSKVFDNLPPLSREAHDHIRTNCPIDPLYRHPKEGDRKVGSFILRRVLAKGCIRFGSSKLGFPLVVWRVGKGKKKIPKPEAKGLVAFALNGESFRKLALHCSILPHAMIPYARLKSPSPESAVLTEYVGGVEQGKCGSQALSEHRVSIDLKAPDLPKVMRFFLMEWLALYTLMAMNVALGEVTQGAHVGSRRVEVETSFDYSVLAAILGLKTLRVTVPAGSHVPIFIDTEGFTGHRPVARPGPGPKDYYGWKNLFELKSKDDGLWAGTPLDPRLKLDSCSLPSLEAAPDMARFLSGKRDEKSDLSPEAQATLQAMTYALFYKGQCRLKKDDLYGGQTIKQIFHNPLYALRRHWTSVAKGSVKPLGSEDIKVLLQGKDRLPKAAIQRIFSRGSAQIFKDIGFEVGGVVERGAYKPPLFYSTMKPGREGHTLIPVHKACRGITEVLQASKDVATVETTVETVASSRRLKGSETNITKQSKITKMSKIAKKSRSSPIKRSKSKTLKQSRITKWSRSISQASHRRKSRKPRSDKGKSRRPYRKRSRK